MWADVRGYEGRYQVSSLGRVKSLARMRRGKNGGQVPVPERIMKLTPKKDTGRTKPYLEVKFRNGGLRTEPCKSFLVHRLVADAFIKRLEPGEQVDHINRVHADNRVENLRVMHYVEHGKAHPIISSDDAKRKFQQAAQEALMEKRKTGWKSGQYIRTEEHREKLKTLAAAMNLERDIQGKFLPRNCK